MAEPSASGAAQPDPLSLWRDWAAQMEEQWNRYLNQVMGTESFAATMGRGMESALSIQQHIAQQVETAMKAWNLPTRSDIVALGERLAAIEERLDQLLEQQQETGDRGQGTGSRKRATAAPDAE